MHQSQLFEEYTLEFLLGNCLVLRFSLFFQIFTLKNFPQAPSAFRSDSQTALLGFAESSVQSWTSACAAGAVLESWLSWGDTLGDRDSWKCRHVEQLSVEVWRTGLGKFSF